MGRRMNRLDPGFLAGLMLAGLALAGGTQAVGQATPAPNILFIMADDLGWADIGVSETTLDHPNASHETPALQFLAQNGVSFTNAYANPSCTPTRTALLSGAYAPRETNGVYQVGGLSGAGNNTLLLPPAQGTGNGTSSVLPDATVTYAEQLGAAGYTTGTVGKFHVTANSQDITSVHGFDENFGGSNSGGPGAYHAVNERFGNNIAASLDPFASNYTQAYVDQNIKPFSSGTDEAAIDALVGTPKHLTDASTDAALDYISRNADDPFFLRFSAHAVHNPVDEAQARDDLLDKYQQDPDADDFLPPYAALLEGLDQSVGRLVDYLQTTDDPRNPGQTLDQNTVVFFYSDNGGTAATSLPNNPLTGAKGQLSEGGIRVPLIAWSGNEDLVAGGRIDDSLVAPIDFFPPFTALGDTDLPENQAIDGVDLSGLLSGDVEELDRENIYWHLPGYGSQRSGQRPQTVTRSDDWKLFYNYEDQSYELYNLSEDIGETNNVAQDNLAVVHDLATDILYWLEDVDAPLAALRTGTLELEISGLAYADGEITAYHEETVTIAAGEEVPFVVAFLSTLAGDYNGDGFVGQADLDLVLLNFGAEVLPVGFNQGGLGVAFDGLVGQNELDAVLLNFGGSAAPNLTAIPEPGAAAGMVVLGVALGTPRRRRGRLDTANA